MEQKVLRVLEYDKIIARLTEFATSEIGKDYCRNLLPFDNLSKIQTEQRMTADALSRVYKKGTTSFSGTTNLGETLKRLELGSSASQIELLRISKLLKVTKRVKDYGFHEFSSEEELETLADSLDEFFAGLNPLSTLVREIDRCIISEEEIADDASSTLKDIRRLLKVTADKIHTQINSILYSSRSYLQDAVVTMRNGRYCLPVKAEYRSQVAGMVHDQSSSGSTFFIEPMVIVKLNNDIRELHNSEQKEIERILAILSGLCAENTEILQTNIHILGLLDFVFAKAILAKSMNAYEPIFNTEGMIHIKQGRHPLIPKEHVVPIDIWLGKDFDLLIVTGPNTGGKTVSLKTVGLFTLMGQAGLFIPAWEGSSLAVFKEVFADIGDEQSIEQSLSTFSSHMTNIVPILEKANSDSLVLFDELGAGTDPTEGAALAISILDFLHNMKIRTIATTHYSELKIYAIQTDGVSNASCEFDIETLRPTYRLLIGMPGKSNAFAISSKLGLPDFIIDEAKRRLNKKDEAFEDVIRQLDVARQALEKDQQDIATNKQKIADLTRSLEAKEARFEEKKDRIMREANEDARLLLQDTKQFIDETIRQINKTSSDTGLLRELEKERTKIREKLNKTNEKLSLKQSPAQAHTQKPQRELRIGDSVKVLSLNLNGTIRSLPNSKGMVTVQMGIIQSNLPISDIVLIEESSSTTKTGRSTTSGLHNMSKAMTISSEINLIGMTVDEALPKLEKYIDDAYLSHLSKVRIVHGRGTGALKNGVHQYLKRIPYIKKFRLGEYNEGDTGVTIAEFK